MTEYTTLRLERPAEHTVLVTLDRPERRNAISFRMFEELHSVCDMLATDDPARILVLTGSGESFCAGLDFEEAERLPAMSTPEYAAHQERFGELVSRLRALPQPIIAAINGAAAGGGLSFALVADIRVGSPAARFNAAFVRIGLSAGDLGVSWALPRIVGFGRAAEIMYTGEFVEAGEAERIGLLNRVVPADELIDAALALAARIASNSPYGIRLSKRVLQANVDAPSLETALELENRGQVLATRTEDMAEALRAFRERRDPIFRDR